MPFVASQVPKILPACDARMHRMPIPVAGQRKNEDLRRKVRAPATQSEGICDTSALNLRQAGGNSKQPEEIDRKKIPEIAASSLVRGSSAASPQSLGSVAKIIQRLINNK